MTKYTISYKSGVESEQAADSAQAALAAEFAAAHASMPEFEPCYSGADWDFCVYPDGATEPFEKSYFIAKVIDEDELFSRRF